MLSALKLWHFQIQYNSLLHLQCGQSIKAIQTIRISLPFNHLRIIKLTYSNYLTIIVSQNQFILFVIYFIHINITIFSFRIKSKYILSQKQEKQEQPERIFQDAAASWINENWGFRSVNGSWSPPPSPIKIQNKVINKPMRQIHPSKLTAWRANHQEALRIVCPRLFEKELSELEVAKLKALIFRKSRNMEIY